MSVITQLEPSTEAFGERLFQSSIATMDVLTIALGDKLGFYAILGDGAPRTSLELATAAAVDERYAREWLEQQAVSGILGVREARAGRQFWLPAEHAAVLSDPLNLAYLAPIARFVAAAGTMLPRIAGAYRTGAGIDWAEYGPDVREAQAAQNRPMFLHQLTQEYLPQITGLEARLSAPGARIADVGCGGGWSSIVMARAYTGAVVDGFDLDMASVDFARRNATESGIEERLSFHAIDAATAPGLGTYDLVTAFECIHDMSDPVAVLAAMRSLARPGGTVLVMDEKVADEFTAPGDDLERLFYGFSVLACLVNGRAAEPSAATGTVMRAGTLEGYAKEGGFSRVDILPIENDFFRFYRLVQ